MLERTAPKAKAYNPAIARVHGNTEMWYVRVGCDVHAKTLNCWKGQKGHHKGRPREVE